MSAPTPAPGDDRPREGFYPDPSIPGYVRYWNGAAWVPGTSRPAPTDGGSLAPPTGAPPAHTHAPAPESASASASAEETGPFFFDEDPVATSAPSAPSVPDARHGSRPEPASAWGADRSRQAGFGGEQDRRVSWGSPQGPDPRLPAGDPARPDDRAAPTDGPATAPPAGPAPSDAGGAGGTFVFRRPTAGQGDSPAGSTATPGASAPAATPHIPGPGGPAADEGTMTFRALSPRAGQQHPAPGAQTGGTNPAGPSAQAGGPGAGGQPASADGGFGGPVAARGDAAAGGPGAPGFGAGKAAAARAAASQAAPASAALSGPQQAAPASGPQSAPSARAASSAPAAPSAHAAAPAPVAPSTPAASSAPSASSAPGRQAAAPAVPQQAAGPQQEAASAPMAAGSGGGQPSWAQQVHRLAGAPGDDQPVTPWKPPVEDVFQAAARRQSEARPAGLGKRLTARLIDTVVLAGVTGAAAVPLGTRALDHVNEKIDAAKLSGETVTVWLLDGTTSVYLGIVLAVLLVFGVLYEVLPTARWGRTLGKKLLGLEVRDIEGHEPPTFGGALRRWLVYSVPGLLVVGVVGVLWGLFDRPWHQCWHDKAAHTFVAG
ncbi:RDD family protein [Streptomyces sp. NBC_00289]|uniref:RDD family protein n=1 Tax=Streptomyces sp. NBC_00289 TaxID=2975703 RepID=UPI00324B7511